MPTTIDQDWQGAKLTNGADPSIESNYNVHGTDDEYVAQADLEAALATFVGGLVLQETQVIERMGPESWRFRARWGRLAPNESGDSTYEFDTGGGTAHITQSLNTLSGTPAPGVATAPDFNGAIGVTSQGVEGVDIVVPVFNFSETHYIDAASVSGAYIATLYNLTGKVSSTSYKGFAAGELLFKGAQGMLKDWTTWQLKYNFAASENASSLAVGPITVPLKRGWDYLWVAYAENEDASAGHLVKRPLAAYVEQVHWMADLSLLGI